MGGERPAQGHDRNPTDEGWFDQTDYRIRLGWGPNGLRRLAPRAEVVVIVDVLSFSTAVDVALGRGAVVLPYRWHDGTEDEFAAANDAIVAARRPETGRLSLRPASLAAVEAGTRLVLPSPNGSALTFGASEAGASTVVVGSIRNRRAVAAAAAARAGLGATDGAAVAVVAAGERWRGTTGPLRPAIEDLIGAGAIVDALMSDADIDRSGPAGGSPEALVAAAAFRDARPTLLERLQGCGSGRELIGRGHGADVELAAELDVSAVVPMLRGPELIDGAGG